MGLNLPLSPPSCSHLSRAPGSLADTPRDGLPSTRWGEHAGLSPCSPRVHGTKGGIWPVRETRRLKADSPVVGTLSLLPSCSQLERIPRDNLFCRLEGEGGALLRHRNKKKRIKKKTERWTRTGLIARSTLALIFFLANCPNKVNRVNAHPLSPTTP
ncbi:hypothetical protein LY76DRAFT_157619 [Colletotrichum caudatum]|nr:hypothetical protein LY76DRAFT_157619 [Colletotrichum caudatum]